jgi:hypothetical protein
LARIRSIKPEFFTNERLSALPSAVHLLAAALLTYADDHGYFNANPGLVKAGCGPLREDFANIPEMLAKLRGIGYVEFYSGTDGRQYGHIVEFSTHQRVDHPKDSKIKPLLKSREILATPREIIAPDQGTGNREQGTGKGKESLSDKSDFARWYAAYPRHEAKGDAEKAWRAVKPLPALDVLLAAVEWQKRDGCLRAREADGRSLIPLPATWLRKARWLDERPTTGGGGADPSIFRDCRP